MDPFSRPAPTTGEVDVDMDFHQPAKLPSEPISPPPLSPDLVRYWEDSIENDQLSTADRSISPDLFEAHRYAEQRSAPQTEHWETDSHQPRRPLNPWWSSQPATVSRRKDSVLSMTQQPSTQCTEWRKPRIDDRQSMGMPTAGVQGRPTSMNPNLQFQHPLHTGNLNRDWEFSYPTASHEWLPDDYRRHREPYKAARDNRDENDCQIELQTWKNRPGSRYREHHESRGKLREPRYSPEPQRRIWAEERYFQSDNQWDNEFKQRGYAQPKKTYGPEERKEAQYEPTQMHCRCCRFNTNIQTGGNSWATQYSPPLVRNEFRQYKDGCKTRFACPSYLEYNPRRETERMLSHWPRETGSNTKRHEDLNYEMRSTRKPFASTETLTSQSAGSDRSEPVQIDLCSPICAATNLASPTEKRSKLSSCYGDETFKTLSNSGHPSSEATNVATVTSETSACQGCMSKNTSLNNDQQRQKSETHLAKTCNPHQNELSGEEVVTSSQGVEQLTKSHRLPSTAVCYATPAEPAPKGGYSSPPEPRGLSRIPKSGKTTVAGLRRTFSFKALATSTPCLKRIEPMSTTNEATPCARPISPTTTVVLQGSTHLHGSLINTYQAPEKIDSSTKKNQLSYDVEE